MTNFLDPHFLINTFGLLGVIAIVFAESGLFFGFFLPGDSLLFTAGLLASQGFLNPPILFFGVILAAILGDNVGYTFGRKIGPAIFKKENSIFFNKKYIEKAHAFYEEHGNKTIILARFIPIVRTFAPIVAGGGGGNFLEIFFLQLYRRNFVVNIASRRRFNSRGNRSGYRQIFIAHCFGDYNRIIFARHLASGKEKVIAPR